MTIKAKLFVQIWSLPKLLLSLSFCLTNNSALFCQRLKSDISSSTKCDQISHGYSNKFGHFQSKCIFQAFANKLVYWWQRHNSNLSSSTKCDQKAYIICTNLVTDKAAAKVKLFLQAI